MKKTLVSALTTALVVGAASTTFAAANPFSDVPADHWAYDAVSQLAADGVIEGYGDSTYNGSRNITRYEMAQMVAKAMAKAPKAGNDKALIDRLAAEFADELNNLGVRVANLERNTDKVKWNGTAEYTWMSMRPEGDSRSHYDNVLFRLEPTAEVNSHWSVKARLDANSDLKSDAGNDGKVELKRVWAEGNYGKFTAKLGKFAPIDNNSIADTTFSGVEAAYGSDLKLTVGAGRISDGRGGDWSGLNVFNFKFDPKTLDADTETSNYQYVGLDYAADNFDLGAHWHHLNANSFIKDIVTTNSGTTAFYKEDVNIWKVNAGYRFDKNVALAAYYAENADLDYDNEAWNVELNYKGAQAENKGTWGAWVAYRDLGEAAMIATTYDVVRPGTKGLEIGANYTLFKNVVLTTRYGWTKTISDVAYDKDTKVNTVFGRINFFF